MGPEPYWPNPAPPPRREHRHIARDTNRCVFAASRGPMRRVWSISRLNFEHVLAAPAALPGLLWCQRWRFETLYAVSRHRLLQRSICSIEDITPHSLINVLGYFSCRRPKWPSTVCRVKQTHGHTGIWRKSGQIWPASARLPPKSAQFWRFRPTHGRSRLNFCRISVACSQTW